MTEVEFHTGVADPLGFACRLLRKAVRQGVRVQVTAPADVLAALDRGLWSFDPHDFVPHVRMPGATAAVARRTPVWLVLTALQEGAPQVLVNLGADPPAEHAALQRVIEIVANDADEAAQGRQRWREYQARGLLPKHRVVPGSASG